MEPLITIYNAGSCEEVLSPRYHHRLSAANMPRVIIQWTRSGYGIHESAGIKQIVPSEYAFVIVTPEPSEYYYPKEGREPWMIDWIDFVGPLALNLFGAFRDKFGPVVSLRRKGTASVHFHRLIKGALGRQHRDRWAESREAYAFLLEWWREALHGDDDVRTIDTVLSLCETMAYRLMTVKELASECGMSREHFTRCFTRQVGISPAAWLRQRRLAAASVLLREDPILSLASIARETGFASARQLMVSFRRSYGVATEEYRRKYNR